MKKWELLRSLDVFTTQYLETALWSSTDETTENGGYPLDDNYGIGDFTLKALKSAIAECNDFRKLAAKELEESGLDESTQGHDFWLTRNRHGTGFWDREGYSYILRKLTEYSHSYGECNASVYRKKIYLD